MRELGGSKSCADKAYEMVSDGGGGGGCFVCVEHLNCIKHVVSLS